jgi:hypothetical protein
MNGPSCLFSVFSKGFFKKKVYKEMHNICQAAGFRPPEAKGSYSSAFLYELDESVFRKDFMDGKDAFDAKTDSFVEIRREFVVRSFRFAKSVFSSPIHFLWGPADEGYYSEKLSDLYSRWASLRLLKVDNPKLEEFCRRHSVTFTDKTEVAEEWFTKNICWSDTSLTKDILGVDCEWQSSSKEGLKVVSVANSSGHCLVWRSDSPCQSALFKKMLSQEDIKKVFVDAREDTRRLTQAGAECKSICDVKDLADELLNLWGLVVGKRHLYRYFFNASTLKSSRKLRMSSWERLSDEAVRYCASDAICSLMLHDVLLLFSRVPSIERIEELRKV